MTLTHCCKQAARSSSPCCSPSPSRATGLQPWPHAGREPELVVSLKGERCFSPFPPARALGLPRFPAQLFGSILTLHQATWPGSAWLSGSPGSPGPAQLGRSRPHLGTGAPRCLLQQAAARCAGATLLPPEAHVGSPGCFLGRFSAWCPDTPQLGMSRPACEGPASSEEELQGLGHRSCCQQAGAGPGSNCVGSSQPPAGWTCLEQRRGPGCRWRFKAPQCPPGARL